MTEIIIGTILVFMLIVAGLITGVVLFFREYWEEKLVPVVGWDQGDTVALQVMRHEQEREKRVCPGCKGTRCWDWNRNHRSCEGNPTLAADEDILAVGRHNKFGIKLVPAGWWPLPRTRMARLKPHLWAKVADHAQILVTVPRTVPWP